jgi:hypothetical protein
MAGTIGVVVIHGMGAQKRRFSDELKAEVSRRLGGGASRFAWQEVFWADVLESRETALWNTMQSATSPSGSAIPLDWRAVRGFVVHNFGDALAYHRDRKPASVYDKVHSIISDALAALYGTLKDPTAPIIVMAHSLGAHMMSDYIWDRQNWKQAGLDLCQPVPNLAAFISFGCNIPLFALEFEVATPIDFPGLGVTKPQLKAAASWLNFLDRDDVLGWPLRPLYESDLSKLTPTQKDTVSRIQDHEINVGSLGTSWNPAAHSAYWTDNDFTKPVATYFATLVKALDA